MRLIVSAIVFVMASVTIAGSILTAVLSLPDLALDEGFGIPIMAGLGFLIAVPFSYWVSGRILSKGPNRP
jgi:hypothetical protein